MKEKTSAELELQAPRPVLKVGDLRDAVGPPLGVAIEVLNEYPEYGEVYRARRDAAAAAASDE